MGQHLVFIVQLDPEHGPRENRRYPALSLDRCLHAVRNGLSSEKAPAICRKSNRAQGENRLAKGRRVFQTAAVEALGRIDLALFRFVNRDCANPWLDGLMRFLSGNPYFWPALAVLAVGLVWKGGSRGMLFLITAAVAAGLANEFVVEPLKAWAQRPRPYVAYPDLAILRVGKGNPNGSMPSAHALNMAMLAALAGWYYRRAIAWGALVALAVGVSRIYNGVHYPSDVLTGMLLGVGVAFATLALLDRVWRIARPRLARRWPKAPASWWSPKPAATSPTAVAPAPAGKDPEV